VLQTADESLEISQERNWRFDVGEKDFNGGWTSECHKCHKEYVLVSVNEERVWKSCSDKQDQIATSVRLLPSLVDDFVSWFSQKM
jgi:hypothetical protein